MWAIKYFDGEKAESISAFSKVVDSTLIIESHQGQVIDHWPLKDISFDPNHLDKKFLMVKHELNARIQILDPALVEAIAQLKKTKFETLLTPKKIIVFGLLFLVAFGFFVFWGTKPLSHYLASKISYDTEKKYAEKLDYDKLFSVCPRSINEQDFISKLETRSQPDPFFNQVVSSVQIINMPQPNAFTLPGGKIFITDALIRDADSSEEILGVLAHEAGHYQKRHVLQGLIRGSFLTLSLNFLTGDFSQFVLVDPNTLSRIVGLQFDRGLEKEADTYAVETLKKLGIGSNGLIHFFEKMKSKSVASGIKIPEFMSTHPADEVRVEYLQEYKTDASLTPLDDRFKQYHCYE